MSTKTSNSNSKKSGKKASFDFEKSLEELKVIQEELEAGNLTLEKSIERFERGTALVKECRKALEDAEKKVKILSKDNSKTVAFDKD